jgi:hypothetical protein
MPLSHIIDIGARAQIGPESFCLPLGYQTRDLAIGVVQVTEVAGPRRAGQDTSGQYPFLDAHIAEAAFLRYPLFLIEDPGLVRAGHHAVLAADAASIIDQH